MVIVTSARLHSDQSAKFQDRVQSYWGYETGSAEQDFVDEIQRSLACCGASGVLDYGQMDVPPSCCKSPTGCDQDRAYKHG